MGYPSVVGHFFGIFNTDKVGDIEMEYSASKKVHLQPDIVKYNPGEQA